MCITTNGIRRIHLQQMDEHRNRLIEYIKHTVLCNEDIDTDAMPIFNLIENLI